MLKNRVQPAGIQTTICRRNDTIATQDNQGNNTDTHSK